MNLEADNNAGTKHLAKAKDDLLRTGRELGRLLAETEDAAHKK